MQLRLARYSTLWCDMPTPLISHFQRRTNSTERQVCFSNEVMRHDLPTPLRFSSGPERQFAATQNLGVDRTRRRYRKTGAVDPQPTSAGYHATMAQDDV